MSEYQLDQLHQMIVAYPNVLHKLTLAVWEQLADYLWQTMTSPL